LAAGAILDAKRGDLVGERTFGEGAVQKTIELPDGAALLLTVAKYETPSGKKIEDEAVTPNVVAGETIADDSDEGTPAKDDEALNKALDILKTKAA
jgi:carboxyl-terminal processing protease